MIDRSPTSIDYVHTNPAADHAVSTTPKSGGETMTTDERDRPTDRKPTLEGSYDPDEAEPYWQRRWVDDHTYAYGGVPDDDPDTVYTIDTPPPTVSGNLHMGHLYGHTLQDFAARYQRMANGEVLFPFGYDDNGIASERLTEEELGIRHGDFERHEFQQKCRAVCAEYEAAFTEKMQRLGCSIDWEATYKTIEPRVQRLSQLSFLDLYDRGREYRKKAPAIWCPECETAISQVETEDAERNSHFNDIAFDLIEPASDGREEFVISTTRPELLPACVSVFVPPDDDANQALVGETARVPLFGQEVPIIADDRVDMEKGSGIVMCCTFGDQTDIEWYQAHGLDLRVAIDASGTMTDLAGEYEGLSTEEAREDIVEDLEEAGYLRDREPITHTVGVHERCETDVEYRVSKQWYVEILGDRLAGLVGAHPLVLAGEVGHRRGLVDRHAQGQVVGLVPLDVLLVPEGTAHHHAGPLLHIDAVVRDDRHLLAEHRDPGGLADEIPVVVVLGVDEHRDAGREQLRSRGRDDELLAWSVVPDSSIAIRRSRS